MGYYHPSVLTQVFLCLASLASRWDVTDAADATFFPINTDTTYPAILTNHPDTTHSAIFASNPGAGATEMLPRRRHGRGP